MCDTPGKGSSTDSSYLRKIKKPLIERKRRERINSCLNQLKNILLDQIKQNGTQVSKLDKADILEMTVSHLRQIQSQQLSVTMATDVTAASEYTAGFNECAREAIRFLHSTQGQGHSLQPRLHNHLTNTLNSGHRNLPVGGHSASDVWNSNMAEGLLMPVSHVMEPHRNIVQYHPGFLHTPDVNGNVDPDSEYSANSSDLSLLRSPDEDVSHDAAGDQSEEDLPDRGDDDQVLQAEEDRVWRPW